MAENHVVDLIAPPCTTTLSTQMLHDGKNFAACRLLKASVSLQTGGTYLSFASEKSFWGGGGGGGAKPQVLQ